MATASTDTAHRFKIRDAASYDELISNFDRLTEKFTTPLAAELISLSGVRTGDRILDIGSGTGVVALMAAARSGRGGLTCGIDLSEPMLACAFANARGRRLLGRTTFGRMDAERLAFADSSFDIGLSLYALLHFPDPAAALLY